MPFGLIDAIFSRLIKKQELQEKFEQQQNEIAALQNIVKTANREIEKLESLKAISERVPELESENENLRSSVTESSVRNDLLERRLESLGVDPGKTFTLYFMCLRW